ncbi:hypothetical protein [Lutimonas sp.]|uniref:hypothetical protein n=1 Tax=Lutimonas sp. TaxID=1872403 RepID=UPI003D9ADAE1
MKNNRIIQLLFIFACILFYSCKEKETALGILQKTINSIDSIETIYYKQDMTRSNPRNMNDTIFRYREMYFKRLRSDSIVGVKGHWYMYSDDKINVRFEDVYDGKRLIRMNNRDSIATIFDLEKYPDFKKKHFWSHNTLYGMQHEFRHMLAHQDSYSIVRLNDTIAGDKNCFKILVKLENKMSMPGFMSKLEDNKGIVSETLYIIDKKTYYVIRMRGENYNLKTPDQKIFIDQKYYDIKFNLKIDESKQFDTSNKSINEFEKRNVKPS